MEVPFSREEIKRAVWDCGGDRAPSPDGFTFAFFKHFWSIIEEDMVRFVEDFSVSAHIPKGCNPSFIALIPKFLDSKVVYDFRPTSLIGCQYIIIGKLLANRLSLVIRECVSSEQSAFIKGSNILYGLLILNEVMEWHRKRKKRLMIFNVNFEKAYDSLRWEFLDLVMAKMGFGFKWRMWIKGCLLNACASILVNGVLTEEFEICRDLRQGDPLSSFLFILAMEGLHADVVDKFKHKLSTWNSHTLSVGGRLALIKVVLGNLPTYYMSLYKVSSAIERNLESMRNNFFIGGDLEDKTMTWVAWLEKSLVGWVLVIKNIYGNSGRIVEASFPSYGSSPWIAILKATKHLAKKGIDLLSLCKRKVEDGSSISFWDDDWCGDRPLKLQFLGCLREEVMSSFSRDLKSLYIPGYALIPEGWVGLVPDVL
ncbi:RNA-directed DNA polymerase, eukaryota, reverse transcriptase zinc-binding domain protein [Tanacetum coccineum]